MIVGPGLLGWVHPSQTLSTVGTMGVIVLMFVVGLETRPSELFKVGGRAFVVGTVGIVLPLVLRLLVRSGPGARDSGGALHRHGARRDVRRHHGSRARRPRAGLDGRSAHRARRGGDRRRLGDARALDRGGLGASAASMCGIWRSSSRRLLRSWASSCCLAPLLVKRHAHWLDRLKIPNAGFVVALLVMLAMAALADSIGLAGIVGAFFAGMMFAETEDRWELTKQARPLYEWLVPYFFVVTGMQVQASLFSSPACAGSGPRARGDRGCHQGHRLRDRRDGAWAGGA